MAEPFKVPAASYLLLELHNITILILSKPLLKTKSETGIIVDRTSVLNYLSNAQKFVNLDYPL